MDNADNDGAAHGTFPFKKLSRQKIGAGTADCRKVVGKGLAFCSGKPVKDSR